MPVENRGEARFSVGQQSHRRAASPIHRAQVRSGVTAPAQEVDEDT
jgi:hypothetical protein